MGDGANALLSFYMRRGFRNNPNYVPRKRPRVCCMICGKEVEASEGLAAHMKSKHPAADSEARCSREHEAGRTWGIT